MTERVGIRALKNSCLLSISLLSSDHHSFLPNGRDCAQNSVAAHFHGYPNRNQGREWEKLGRNELQAGGFDQGGEVGEGEFAPRRTLVILTKVRAAARFVMAEGGGGRDLYLRRRRLLP